MEIYVITNKINGKQYVGKTELDTQKRFHQHVLSASNKKEAAIHRAIRKYGQEAFLVEIVDIALDSKSLSQKEIQWISKLDTFGKGYNMTKGGDGSSGRVHSEATKEKIRQKRNQYIQDHPESRQQAAEWAKLAVVTDENRESRRLKMLGNQFSKGMTYIRSEETKEKNRIGNLGRVVSQETRNKISQSNKGKTCGVKNAMSDPTKRAKVAASKIGRKKMYRSDGTAYMGYPDDLSKS